MNINKYTWRPMHLGLSNSFETLFFYKTHENIIEINFMSIK
jgi:hypothetical protein